MFKLIVKKIIAILRLKNCLTGPMHTASQTLTEHSRLLLQKTCSRKTNASQVLIHQQKQTVNKQSFKQNFERKIAIIFSPSNLYICFGSSKEPSHRDGSFEHPQYMFWLRNKQNNFQIRTFIWSTETARMITYIKDLNYPDQSEYTMLFRYICDYNYDYPQ